MDNVTRFLRPVPEDLLLKMAREQLPTVIHNVSIGHEAIYDYPTKAYFGDLLPEEMGTPALYVWGWIENELHYEQPRFYFGYAVYHRVDPAAPHDFDLEAFMISRPVRGVDYTMVFSIFHWEHRFYRFPEAHRTQIIIDAGGHGIRTNLDSAQGPFATIYDPSAWDLIPMDDFPAETLQRAAKGHVKLPWGYVAAGGVHRLKSFAARHNLPKTDGLFYYRPDLLRRYCEGHKNEIMHLLKDWRETLDPEYLRD